MYPHDGYSIINFEDGSQAQIFVTDEIQIGIGTAMDPAIRIGSPDKPLTKLIIGDHCRLFAGQIMPRQFTCGDYVTIHEGVWCYGRESATIPQTAVVLAVHSKAPLRCGGRAHPTPEPG